MEEVGRYQIATLVVLIHEPIRYVDQSGEAGREDHQSARDLLGAELR